MGVPTTPRGEARPGTKAFRYYQYVDELVARGADRATAERLAGADLVVNDVGTVGILKGRRAYALTAQECLWLRRQPGPNNY